MATKTTYVFPEQIEDFRIMRDEYMALSYLEQMRYSYQVHEAPPEGLDLYHQCKITDAATCVFEDQAAGPTGCADVLLVNGWRYWAQDVAQVDVIYTW